VLFTSSGAVYASDEDKYGQMKLNSEWELINGEVDVKIARCFTSAGPGIALSDQYVLGNFISRALCGEDLHIWGDGAAIRTYLYMTDVIAWLFRILVYGDYGKAYDVGAEQEITMYELAHLVQAHFYPSPKVITDNMLTIERFKYYVPDLTDTFDLGCRVEIGTEEAISKTVEYYKEKYK